MGPVSIGVEVQRNTDGDTPSTSDGDLRSDEVVLRSVTFSSRLVAAALG